jgi:hypothetical protein
VNELKAELQKLNWKYTTLKSVVGQKDLVNDQLIGELEQIKTGVKQDNEKCFKLQSKIEEMERTNKEIQEN